jgi:sec-independent protein translocase protein TatC
MSEHSEMSFFEHLEELRWRLIKALGAVFFIAIFAFYFSDHILIYLFEPLNRLDESINVSIQNLKPQGVFNAKLEIAFLVGVILGIPVILYQIWKFVAPGLKKSERRFAPLVIISFIVCFSGGAFFSYFAVFPLALEFLLSMGPDTIQNDLAINEYIGFFLRLLVAFGILFEMPVLSYVLSKMGLLTPRFMTRYRSHAILIIFILAAVLTPPDAITQTMLAIPLVLLYELSIGISYLVHRGKRKQEEAEDNTD